MRRAVSAVSVIHEGKEYRVTMSIGVTTFNESDTHEADVLVRADLASYEAKNLGRDNIVVYVSSNDRDSSALFD